MWFLKNKKEQVLWILANKPLICTKPFELPIPGYHTLNEAFKKKRKTT